jgi:YD repeat-containing protein
LMTTHTDWLGRPISVIYPDNEVLTYTYDALGRPDQLKSSHDPIQNHSLVDLAYTTLGQIDTQTLGNGIVIDNTYNTANRLSSRTAGTNNSILNFAYSYDNAGNITQITDYVLSETHDYQYDFLNRLTSAEAYTTGAATNYKYRQQWTYDAVGNITQMNDWITGGQAYHEPGPFVDAFTSFNVSNAGSFPAVPVLQTGLLFEDNFERPTAATCPSQPKRLPLARMGCKPSSTTRLR